MAADPSEGKSGRPSIEAGGQEAGSLLDRDRLLRIIKDFNLARTNAALYPPEHPLIAMSLGHAYEALVEEAGPGPGMTMVASGDGLLVGSDRLDARFTAVREFTGALSERSIFSITFGPGFTRDDLLLLHRVLNTPPEDLAAQGGAAAAAHSLGLSRIVVRDVDYSRFQATEGLDGGASAEEDPHERAKQLWQRFVDRVLAEDGGVGETPAPDAGEGPASNVARLARRINDDPENAAAALRNYGALLSDDEGRPPDPVVLGRIGELLRRLNPELRNKLLTMTFEEWKDRDDVTWEGLGGDLLAEMLEHAGREQVRIPPALTRLVNVLSASGADAGPAPAILPDDSSRDLGALKAVLAEEGGSSYVDAEYNEMLDRLSRAPRAAGEPAGPAASAEPEGAPHYGWRESLAADLAAALDPAIVLICLFDLLIGVLEGPLEIEDIAAFAGAIAAQAPELLAAGEYSRLAQALRLLAAKAAEAEAKGTPAVRDALLPFREPGFAKGAVRSYLAGAAGLDEAADFFGALGFSAIQELVDLYVQGEVPGGNTRLVELLAKLGDALSEEMGRRLRSEDPGVVRRALRFCLKYGGMDPGAIRPLLEHPDELVRTDALTVLLDSHDATASAGLLRALSSPVEHEAVAAVRLAGRYRQAETVPALVNMIPRGRLKKPDAPRNLEIVRALGRIGDPEALPHLRKLAARKSPFFPAERRNLKLAIYESLDGYPPERLSGLLDDGLRAEEHRIRLVSQALRKRGAKAAPPDGPSSERGAS